MQATKPKDNEIVLSRTFAAPRETVFAALTQEEHLASWLMTTDMALVDCKVDLRVGGSLRYVFQRPNGKKLEVRGTYEAVDPPRRFVYAETYDFSPLQVLVTTDLDAVAAKTVFKQTLLYSSKQERDEDFDGVATSSKEAYARLERYLAQMGQ
ncbi:MAG: SRPBCC domain-containing protein [Gemmataceae bacterium]|nr:SRPBCC domain-containing protein [Gemmataceae bacterium]MCI0738413.1 SRPBCC domain-containing protein [Gemmataceae bacterium]